MNPAIANKVGLNLNVIMPNKQYDNRKAPLYTRDGQIMRAFEVNMREPLFTNGYVDGVRNSIEFQNAGSTAVLINGNWTILPGGSKKFESSDEVNVNANRFTVYFPSDPFNGGGLNRLEVCETILSDLTVTFAKSKGIEFRQ